MPDHGVALDALGGVCAACRMCELGSAVTSDSNPQVPGAYDHMSILPRYMVIGPNPGLADMREGRPFAGPVGVEFDKALEIYGSKYGITRSKFYMTYMVKCYAGEVSQHNIDQCGLFLKMEIALLKPKFVVALGDIVASELCPNSEDNLGKLITSERYGVKVLRMCYPSPRNLNYDDIRAGFDRDMHRLCELIFRLECPF